jgi:hypothetical protein
MPGAKSFALPLIFLSAGLAFVPSTEPVQACGMAYPRDFEAAVADETALIVYDSATKTEHFLRLAKFETTSSDFGFFVPTPSQPELAEASAEIFPMLAKITEPPVVHRTVKQEAGIGCGLTAMAPKGAADQSDSMQIAGGVRVIERKRIGAFDAVVLKADNAKTLQDWLKENEYTSRPALEAWIGEYIRLGWYITAFKIAGRTATTESMNAPIRISFKTDVPVYPYREPLDQPPKASHTSERRFRLFVLADSRVNGRLGTGKNAQAFAGRTVWSKPVETAAIAPALAAGKFPPLTRDWHLTEFEDSSDPRMGTDDVYFTKSAKQELVERPPHEIITYETTYWGVGLCCTACLVMPILMLLGLIRLFRPTRRVHS